MINYQSDKDYVTCDILIPIKHKFVSYSVYKIMYDLKCRPSYPTAAGIIFKFNDFRVIVKNEYILMENLYKMSISKIDNILKIINELWRVIKFPGFVTKYEIITKIRSINNDLNKIMYNKNDIVPFVDILKILYNNTNSLFHYIPMDVIHVICDYM
jgi:hypothetical protein